MAPGHFCYKFGGVVLQHSFTAIKPIFKLFKLFKVPSKVSFHTDSPHFTRSIRFEKMAHMQLFVNEHPDASLGQMDHFAAMHQRLKQRVSMSDILQGLTYIWDLFDDLLTEHSVEEDHMPGIYDALMDSTPILDEFVCMMSQAKSDRARRAAHDYLTSVIVRLFQ